jgi:hypothetical protein
MAIGKARKIAKYVEDASQPDGYKFVPADTVSFDKSFANIFVD